MLPVGQRKLTPRSVDGANIAAHSDVHQLNLAATAVRAALKPQRWLALNTHCHDVCIALAPLAAPTPHTFYTHTGTASAGTRLRLNASFFVYRPAPAPFSKTPPCESPVKLPAQYIVPTHGWPDKQPGLNRPSTFSGQPQVTSSHGAPVVVCGRHRMSCCRIGERSQAPQ